MIGQLMPLTALLVGSALLLAGHGVLVVLVPVRLDLEGFGGAVVGLIGTAYFVGVLLGARYAGQAIRRVGHIRAFSAFAAVFAGMALVLALMPQALTWLILRLAAGFSMAGLGMAIESWINVTSRTEWRGRVMAVYMIVSYAALGLGQLSLYLYSPEGSELFVLAALFVTASIVPLALTRASAPAPQGLTPGIARQVLESSPLAVVGAFTAGLVLGAFYAMAPLFAARIGLTADLVGLLVATAMLGALLGQAPVGWISDAVDRRGLIVGLALTIFGVSIALLFVHAHVPALILCFIVFGAAAFTLYPVSLSHGADQLPPGGDMLALSSALLATFSVGAAAGPAISGLAFQAAGPSGLFLFTAGVGVAAAAFGLWRMIHGVRIAPEDRVSFVVMPSQATPTTVGLDPRVENPEGVFVETPAPAPPR
jgi:MFS family permease